MSVVFDSWVERARNVRIERVIEQRRIRVNGKIDRDGPCPKCGGDDRFSVNLKKQCWNCRQCKSKTITGDVIGLIQWLDGVDFVPACETLTGEPRPDAKPNGKDRTAEATKIVAARFDYEDESGKLLSQVERVEYRNADGSVVLTKDGKRKKTFRQRRPNPERPGKWLWNVDGLPAVPYRLPELIEAIGNEQTILIVEGEAKVDLLRSWSVLATCCQGGAKKWRPEHSEHLRGANIVILPDNDAAGRDHAELVAASLQDVAASVRILELPELAPKGDVIDWAAAGQTADELWRLIETEAKPWTQPVGLREAEDKKPKLLIENCNPDRTVAALRNILAEASGLYDRGVPVRLAFDQIQRGAVAQVITPDALVLTAHTVCRPRVLKEKSDGAVVETDARLPRSFAVMYLDWRGEWRLPPLNGIATAPLLRDDGAINSTEGYDWVSGMWCENVPDLAGRVPERPTKDQAPAALTLIRDTFKTFCFADAELIEDGRGGVAVVDVSKPPGRDESAFLVALLTAVCRPSLHLAPGVLLRAAPMSGAGAGKGLLARCMCIIAFGREPHAVTAGATAEELEKRIAAELIEGSPTLLLDNLNNTAFKSNLLASAITERPARVRLLGRSQMVPLNATAFVILTGNGLTVSEDLARRFIAVDFDPRTEDPEARRFTTDIRAEVTARRTELLAALLTIWRWGRIATDINTGLSLGSFEQWCRWVRDPLLALGCQDPAKRVSEAKERDGRRQALADLFAIWWQRHRDQPVAVRLLHDDVRQAADPQGHGRQYLAAQLEKLAGTRMAGYVFTRQAPAGKWGAATYALKKTATEEHRDHRGHRADDPNAPYGLGGHAGNGQAPVASQLR